MALVGFAGGCLAVGCLAFTPASYSKQFINGVINGTSTFIIIIVYF